MLSKWRGVYAKSARWPVQRPNGVAKKGERHFERDHFSTLDKSCTTTMHQLGRRWPTIRVVPQRLRWPAIVE